MPPDGGPLAQAQPACHSETHALWFQDRFPPASSWASVFFLELRQQELAGWPVRTPHPLASALVPGGLALWLLPGGGRAGILHPRSKVCSHASMAPCALRRLLPREECAPTGHRSARPANPQVPQQNGRPPVRQRSQTRSTLACVSGILPSDPQLWLTPAPSTAAC